mmetsp:Transcript_63600/g.88421  ORF Transcript_63600/g.88421 Transcript_63600/m.88421 type:complete len:168 (+) Transcript_63600:1-504(+)
MMNDAPSVLIGTKIDLPRVVPKDAAEQMAKSHGMEHFETSAKEYYSEESKNTHEIFKKFARMMKDKYDKTWSTPWSWTNHKHFPRRARLWVENVLVCVHRLTHLSGNEQKNNQHVEEKGIAGVINAISRWFDSILQRNKHKIPSLPWEMWYHILSFIPAASMEDGMY